MLPEEMFFHTIILNSSFSESVINDNLRHIDSSRSVGRPKILNKSDFKILSSLDKLNAKKFDINYDCKILDLIDEKVLNIK